MIDWNNPSYTYQSHQPPLNGINFTQPLWFHSHQDHFLRLFLSFVGARSSSTLARVSKYFFFVLLNTLLSLSKLVLAMTMAFSSFSSDSVRLDFSSVVFFYRGDLLGFASTSSLWLVVFFSHVIPSFVGIPVVDNRIHFSRRETHLCRNLPTTTRSVQVTPLPVSQIFRLLPFLFSRTWYWRRRSVCQVLVFHNPPFLRDVSKLSLEGLRGTPCYSLLHFVLLNGGLLTMLWSFLITPGSESSQVIVDFIAPGYKLARFPTRTNWRKRRGHKSSFLLLLLRTLSTL